MTKYKKETTQEKVAKYIQLSEGYIDAMWSNKEERITQEINILISIVTFEKSEALASVKVMKENITKTKDNDFVKTCLKGTDAMANLIRLVNDDAEGDEAKSLLAGYSNHLHANLNLNVQEPNELLIVTDVKQVNNNDNQNNNSNQK